MASKVTPTKQSGIQKEEMLRAHQQPPIDEFNTTQVLHSRIRGVNPTADKGEQMHLDHVVIDLSVALAEQEKSSHDVHVLEGQYMELQAERMHSGSKMRDALGRLRGSDELQEEPRRDEENVETSLSIEGDDLHLGSQRRHTPQGHQEGKETQAKPHRNPQDVEDLMRLREEQLYSGGQLREVVKTEQAEKTALEKARGARVSVTCVFLGASGVGKTSIIRALKGEEIPARHVPTTEHQHHAVEFTVEEAGQRRRLCLDVTDVDGSKVEDHLDWVLQSVSVVVFVYAKDDPESAMKILSCMHRIGARQSSSHRVEMFLVANKLGESGSEIEAESGSNASPYQPICHMKLGGSVDNELLHPMIINGMQSALREALYVVDSHVKRTTQGNSRSIPRMHAVKWPEIKNKFHRCNAM